LAVGTAAPVRARALTVSPGVSWHQKNGTLYVYGDSLLKVEHCPKRVVDCLELLETGTADYRELREESDEASGRVLDLLERIGALVPGNSGRWAGTAAERQVDYFTALGRDADAAQARLEQAHIALLGVGGVGGAVAAHLVGAGVRRYTLIDHDEVQLSNFNRQQLFSRADLGRPKVAATADWIRSRRPGAEIVEVEAMAEDPAELAGHLQSADVLVLAADQPAGLIGMIAAQACLSVGAALVMASCGLRTASYSPVIPPEDLADEIVSMRAASRFAPAPPAPRPMSASFGPTNTIVGAYAALELLHYLAGAPVRSATTVLRFGAQAARQREFTAQAAQQSEISAARSWQPECNESAKWALQQRGANQRGPDT
jgi:molybdopterin/thiamine biosynthesis adenylyltransferase